MGVGVAGRARFFPLTAEARVVVLADAVAPFEVLSFLEDPAFVLVSGASRLTVLHPRPLMTWGFLTGVGASEVIAMGSYVLPGAVMIFTLLLW